MFKKLLAVLLAALMIFAVGCKKKGEEKKSTTSSKSTVDKNSDKKGDTSTEEKEETPAENLVVNPLTGVAEFSSEEKAKRRPVAIAVNNYSENGNFSVQKVQSGLSKADIIYETEVEGGITRLLAVYQDVTQAQRVGTVRSARYQFIDLAMGHNAIYVHCGQNKYAESHLKDIDDIDISGKYNSKSADGAQKYELGLASEHELFVWAGDLWNSISKKFKTEQTSARLWADFTDEKVSLDGGSATNVSIPYPTQTTKFVYDEKSGLYTRYIGNAAQTDYYTKEKTQVKNVFILSTSKAYFDDGKTPKISLQSGSGYYITNGTVQPIKWSKGAAKNGFTFTDNAGNEIKVSAGNSWVSIVNKATTKPVIK